MAEECCEEEKNKAFNYVPYLLAGILILIILYSLFWQSSGAESVPEMVGSCG